MKTALYFVALMPPKPIMDQITGFKQYAADHFNSRRAFRSPAHITLQAPFRWDENEIGRVQTVLSDFSKKQIKFPVQFKNFNCFAPKVIYVDVIRTNELDELKSALNDTLFQELSIPKDNYPIFHPHATIAFRDLESDIFPVAWDYFSKQTYEATFEANAMTLLKNETGVGWHIEATFHFE